MPDATETFHCSFHQRRALKKLVELAKEIVATHDEVMAKEMDKMERAMAKLKARERLTHEEFDAIDPFTANAMGWNIKVYRDFIAWVEAEERGVEADATKRATGG